MLKRYLAAGALLAVSAGGLVAQPQGQRQRMQLQQRVMERQMQNFRSQAGLTDQQFARFREVASRSSEARQASIEREREVWRALEGQLRPGIAADADSVSALLDALVQVQADRVERARSDQAAYAEFLTPVQRAMLTVMTQRLQQNIEEIMRRRRQPPNRR